MRQITGYYECSLVGRDVRDSGGHDQLLRERLEVGDRVLDRLDLRVAGKGRGQQTLIRKSVEA